MPHVLDAAQSGLTTTRAPYIEDAQRNGQLFIHQPYELYSAENHEAWRRLYSRIAPKWERYANPAFLQGVCSLGLPADRVPRLDEVNRFLCPLTGFQAKAVSGYVPSFVFFDCLRNRAFPTTITIRSKEALDYLPEPDIFHDVVGHVPMHTHIVFADFLERYGRVCAAISDELVLEKLGRLFWYTVEFGIIRQRGSMKVYGSGLISSHGECANVLSGNCAIRDFALDKVLETPVKVDEMHKLLFAVGSFEQIYEAMCEAERRAKLGIL